MGVWNFLGANKIHSWLVSWTNLQKAKEHGLVIIIFFSRICSLVMSVEGQLKHTRTKPLWQYSRTKWKKKWVFGQACNFSADQLISSFFIVNRLIANWKTLYNLKCGWPFPLFCAITKLHTCQAKIITQKAFRKRALK